MRRRRLRSDTLPVIVRDKYCNGKKTVLTDTLLESLARYVEKDLRDKEIYDILSNKDKYEKLISRSKLYSNDQARLDQIVSLGKVSVRNYIIKHKNEYIIVSDQPSVLDEKYWNEKGR